MINQITNHHTYIRSPIIRLILTSFLESIFKRLFTNWCSALYLMKHRNLVTKYLINVGTPRYFYVTMLVIHLTESNTFPEMLYGLIITVQKFQWSDWSNEVQLNCSFSYVTREKQTVRSIDISMLALNW